MQPCCNIIYCVHQHPSVNQINPTTTINLSIKSTNVYTHSQCYTNVNHTFMLTIYMTMAIINNKKVIWHYVVAETHFLNRKRTKTELLSTSMAETRIHYYKHKMKISQKLFLILTFSNWNFYSVLNQILCWHLVWNNFRRPNYIHLLKSLSFRFLKFW